MKMGLSMNEEDSMPRKKPAMKEKVQELEENLDAMCECSKLYHEELVQSKKAFDVLMRKTQPSTVSDLLAELYDLRATDNVQVKTSDRIWLEMFKDFHNLDNMKDAVSKLISIHKAWNKGLGDEFDRLFKEQNAEKRASKKKKS